MKIYSWNLIPGLIVRIADGESPVDIVITTVRRDGDEEFVHATGQVANETTLWSNKFDYGVTLDVVGITPFAASGDELGMTLGMARSGDITETLAENLDYGTNKD